MSDKIVTAVKKNETVISICCGKYCFSVNNGVLEKDQNVEDFYKKQNTEKYKDYIATFDLCAFAYENEIYDNVEVNS